MATKRFIDNPPLEQYDKIAVPLTNVHDGIDYQANGADLAEIILDPAGANKIWGMSADSIEPTAHSFRDPEYLKAGVHFIEDISNTEDKPDKLANKKVQFARLLCERGYSATEKLTFVKQYLFYVNMTDQVLELSMRGVLLNGGGEVQGATPWKTGTDTADNAKEAAHAANADNATNADNAAEAAHAANADNATNATTAGTATNAGYSGNSAMLGGLAANRYALKSETEVAIVGNIQLFGCEVKPEQGWLLCDGSPLDVSTYPRLAETIGVKFDPDGAVVKLPDLRNKVAYGASGEYALGKYIDESLPNIKGFAVPRANIQDEGTTGIALINADGALTYHEQKRTTFYKAAGVSSGLYGTGIQIDASKTSSGNGSAYKDGAKVHVDGVALNWYIKY